MYQFNAFLKYLGLRPNDDNDLLQLLRREPEEIEELISGHELDEDFRRAGNSLRDILSRDFEREIALAEVFVDRNDLTEAAYHRAMAYAIHNTLRDLEMMIG